MQLCLNCSSCVYTDDFGLSARPSCGESETTLAMGRNITHCEKRATQGDFLPRC